MTMNRHAVKLSTPTYFLTIQTLPIRGTNVTYVAFYARAVTSLILLFSSDDGHNTSTLFLTISFISRLQSLGLHLCFRLTENDLLSRYVVY
jgi:hypothetical protein